MKYARW